MSAEQSLTLHITFELRPYTEKDTGGGTQNNITLEHSVKDGLREELNPHGASMGELQ